MTKPISIEKSDVIDDSPEGSGKDLNERKHEAPNINDHNSRNIDEVEKDYENIENSFDVLRENHGVNIAFDKSGQRKLILEIPFREPRNHLDRRNVTKSYYPVDGSDMTEKEISTKRIEKTPIAKKNIPRTFEKIKIQNYTLPDEIQSESNEYSSYERQSTNSHEIDGTDGTNRFDNVPEPQSSSEIQNPHKYYRQNKKNSDFFKPQSIELSSFSDEDKKSSGTNAISREAGKYDMYIIIISLKLTFLLRPYIFQRKILLSFYTDRKSRRQRRDRIGKKIS